MRISLDWLKDFIDLPEDTNRIIESLTLNGFQVENIIKPYKSIHKDLKIVKIIKADPHPSREELTVVRILDNVSEHTVICGAKNVRVGATGVWAPPGSEVSGHQINERKFGAIESSGMLLSLMELGLEEKSTGIWLFNFKGKIGTRLSDILKPDDTVLEINITPNRGDALSHIGIARELSAYFDIPLRTPPIDFESVDRESPISINIENDTACPIYQGTYAENIVIKESEIKIQKRLIESGLRPINNIVDLSNYIMLETGHPTHTFDYNYLKGQKIIVRNAMDQEKITLLNGVTLSLNRNNLVICDEKTALALAGIMGGEYSSIVDSTDKILLECAVFDPDSIRNTTSMHNVSSDSSYRFARGVDTSTVDYASKRFMRLLKEELPDAVVYRGILVKRGDIDQKKKIRFRYEKCKRILNRDCGRDFIKKILISLGFKIDEEDSESINLTGPSHRYDNSMEEDIIEEVARIYGYNRFGIRLPHTETFDTELNLKDAFTRKIRYLLSNLGLSEVINYTFISEDTNSIFATSEQILIKNPIAQDMISMRKSILPSLINNAILNISRQNKNIRLFESGSVFYKREEITEELHLGILLSGNRFDRVWSQPQIEYDFYDLKGILEIIFDSLKIDKINFLAQDIPNFLHPRIAATIEINGKKTGLLGEIHPNLLKKLDIRQKLFVAELNLDILFEAFKEAAILFKAYSPFPAVDRDIALVIDRQITSRELINEIRNMNIPLIEEIEIFDLYEGKGIEEGKKSIGIALKYRSGESTLTDEVIEKIHSKIIDNLSKKFYARLR